jgi:hypothetical protein
VSLYCCGFVSISARFLAAPWSVRSEIPKTHAHETETCTATTNMSIVCLGIIHSRLADINYCPKPLQAGPTCSPAFLITFTSSFIINDHRKSCFRLLHIRQTCTYLNSPWLYLYIVYSLDSLAKMRVQLAAASLVLPSIVSAKLAKGRQQSAGANGASLRLLRQARSGKPLWKSHDLLLATSQAVGDADSSNNNYQEEEPDVGILSSSSFQRNLQTQSNTTSSSSSSIIDLCKVVDAETATKCDCSNWLILTGSFECSLYNGDTYCFHDYQSNVCGTVTFGVNSDGSNVSIDYCVNTTKPSKHSYWEPLVTVFFQSTIKSAHPAQYKQTVT